MDEQSIWKKEISFRRKPKAPEPPPEPGAEPTSIWKKEISFKRKEKDAQPEAPAAASPEAPTPAADEPKQSIWKKEISFGKKQKKEAPAPLEAEPVVPEEPVEVVTEPEPPVAVEPMPVETVSEPPLPPAPEAAPVVLEPEPTPVFHAPARVAEEPEPVLDLPPALPEREEPAPMPPEPLPPAAVILPPASVTLPPVDAPAPVSPPTAISVPPTSGPEPPPAPEPTVVHPPVPAAELPPEPRSEQSVPFWKREIAIGRRGGEKKDSPGRATKVKRAKTPKVKVDRGSGKGKKLVGLKIGASQLAAARVSNNGSAELLQVAREPLDAGVVVGGELRDPDALALALKDFFTKHKLPKRGVRLGIANNRIGVRTFDVDGIADEKQLDNAIRFRAQEALPIPIDEAVLDYQILREWTNEEGGLTRRVLLVVAYREQIDRYTEACKKAGIGLVGIDLEAFALLRALQAPQEGAGDDPDAALVAVAIGHERSTFAVSDGRVCEFTRVLEWGGAAINVALARALDAAPSEVEGVKRALSLMDEMTPDGVTSEQALKGRDAIRRAIQTFARELVSSLQFYQNQPGSLEIGEIVLTGGTTHLPGLAAELEKLIGVRVRVGDPLSRMKVSKKLGQPEQIGSLSVAIGLGIED
jgi:type IV pilus assembly protein PilM